MKRHILSTLFVIVLYTLYAYWLGIWNDVMPNFDSPVKTWLFVCRSSVSITFSYYVVGLYVAENLNVNERYRKLLYLVPLLTSCLAPVYILVHTNGVSPLFEVGWSSKMISPAPVVVLSLLIFYVPWKRGIQRKDGYIMSPQMASAAIVFIVYKILSLAESFARGFLCEGESLVSDVPYFVKSGATNVFLYYAIWLYVAEYLRRRFNTGHWVYFLPLLIGSLIIIFPILMIAASFTTSMREFFNAMLYAMSQPTIYLYEEFCMIPAAMIGLYYYYRIRDKRYPI